MSLSTIQSPNTLDDPRPSSNETTTLSASLWSKHYSLGAQAHTKKQYKEAVTHFEQCVIICLTLLKPSKSGQNAHKLPCMLHQSGHNLAACHNALGNGLLAKKTLEQLHKQLIAVACSEQYPRTIRLGVLGSIDQSLFSLTSQLAYLNQVNEIHSVILKTENTVTSLSEKLLNAA
ncbi:hypothetical protein ACVBE9_02270 [Eionea flava]